MPNTYEAFHNLHIMMWMCICICHYHVTTAPIGQAFWNLPRIMAISRGVKPKLTAAAVIEAKDPFEWASTSTLRMSNTDKVFHNLHMMWMCICICPYHILPLLLLAKLLELPLEFCFCPPRGKQQYSAVVEPMDLLKWVSTSNV